MGYLYAKFQPKQYGDVFALSFLKMTFVTSELCVMRRTGNT